MPLRGSLPWHRARGEERVPVDADGVGRLPMAVCRVAASEECATPFFAAGPHRGEAGGSNPNKAISACTDPVEAVDPYIPLDVAAGVNINRLFALTLDGQHARDQASGYRIAGLPAQHFRREPILRTPFHPNAGIAVAPAAPFFEQQGREAGANALVERVTGFDPCSQDVRRQLAALRPACGRSAKAAPLAPVRPRIGVRAERSGGEDRVTVRSERDFVVQVAALWRIP